VLKSGKTLTHRNVREGVYLVFVLG
jgi:hypothetical protein